MARFVYKGRLNGEQPHGARKFLIGNSAAITIGGAVASTGGYIVAGTAGAKIAGICVGITTKNGLPIANASAASYSGTFVESTGVYTAAADNATVDQVMAEIVMDKDALWENDSAGDLAQADVMGLFDLTSATQIADQNGSATAGAFQLIEINPNDASMGLFRIAESRLDYAVQQ